MHKNNMSELLNDKSSLPEVFLGKDVVKICSKFTGEHPYRSAICNFIEIALWHGCSPVNSLHIFRTPFRRNTSGWLLLKTACSAITRKLQGTI